jgi:hypothetical protein
MEHLGARNVGLDGVPAQEGNYRKSGFSLAYKNVRYEGVTKTGSEQQAPEVVTTGPADLNGVSRLDREVFPAAREAFLGKWLSLPESHALAVKESGKLEGYGVIRRCRTGYKIGPLVANSESAAESLFRGLTSCVLGGSPVFIDVPGANPVATKLVERYGMKPISEAARMYNKSEPRLRIDKLFGVTSLELG